MPLPIAHPAAILPLRRYCPKYFSFSALVIGSLVPDVAYALNGHRSFATIITFFRGLPGKEWFAAQGIRSWDGLSHSLLGSVLFCLPAGLLVSLAFRLLRGSFVATLPNPHREALAPLCALPAHSLLTYLGSLLVGGWSHLAWDLLTKDNWWLAKSVPLLQMQVAEIGNAHIEVDQAIWIVSSVGGTVVLVVAYIRWLQRKGLTVFRLERTERPYYLGWLIAVMLPGFVVVTALLWRGGFQLSVRWLFHFFHFFCEVYFVLFGGCVVVITLGSMLKRALSLKQ